MRQELDDELCTKYPLIFKDRHHNPKETLMCFGFECSDGWYNIIDVLCGLLYSTYNMRKERYERLLELGVGNVLFGDKILTQEELDKAHQEMIDEEAKIPVAVQVKEKFGGLRFYVDKATQEHYNYIRFAESMSYRTCEECGLPGKLYAKGWHRVLCADHAKKYDRT